MTKPPKSGHFRIADNFDDNLADNLYPLLTKCDSPYIHAESLNFLAKKKKSPFFALNKVAWTEICQEGGYLLQEPK